MHHKTMRDNAELPCDSNGRQGKGMGKGNGKGNLEEE